MLCIVLACIILSFSVKRRIGYPPKKYVILALNIRSKDGIKGFENIQSRRMDPTFSIFSTEKAYPCKQKKGN